MEIKEEENYLSGIVFLTHCFLMSALVRSSFQISSQHLLKKGIVSVHQSKVEVQRSYIAYLNFHSE